MIGNEGAGLVGDGAGNLRMSSVHIPCNYGIVESRLRRSVLLYEAMRQSGCAWAIQQGVRE